MTLHPAVTVLVAVLFGFCLFFGVILLGIMIARGVWDPTMLGPFGLALALWCFMAGGFAFEAHLSLQRLREIVAAEPDVPTEAPMPTEERK